MDFFIGKSGLRLRLRKLLFGDERKYMWHLTPKLRNPILPFFKFFVMSKTGIRRPVVLEEGLNFQTVGNKAGEDF